MSGRPSTLAEVRHRLDQLVEQRTVSGLSMGEEAEYRDLVEIETRLLAASSRHAAAVSQARRDG
jgi:hypothetical protein